MPVPATCGKDPLKNSETDNTEAQAQKVCILNSSFGGCVLSEMLIRSIHEVEDARGSASAIERDNESCVSEY